MNVAVIDDMRQDREQLNGFLSTFFTENYAGLPLIISLFENEEDFFVQFKRHLFDFIFIDYYLGDTTGLELAKQIRQKDSSTILIFTTRSSDYAIDSYKVKASGYLVKPYSYEDLAEIIALTDAKMIRERQFIELSSGSRPVKIILKDIVYCDITGHYTQIHTQSMGVKKFRITLSELMGILASYPEFLPCYRGCVINMMHVRKITEYNFLMTNGDEIPFRKKEKEKLFKQYSDFLFEQARRDQR